MKLDLTQDYEILRSEFLGYKTWHDVWYFDGMPDDYWAFMAEVISQNGSYYVVVGNPDGIAQVQEADSEAVVVAMIDKIKDDYIQHTRSTIVEVYREFGQRARRENLITDFNNYLVKKPQQKYINFEVELNGEWYQLSPTDNYDCFKSELNYFN